MVCYPQNQKLKKFLVAAILQNSMKKAGYFSKN